MSEITIEEVHALARLAKISLSDEQAIRMQKELSAILGFVEQLNKADTKDLEPTYQVTGLMNATRQDEIIDYGVTPEQLLKSAPGQQGGSLKVKRVL